MKKIFLAILSGVIVTTFSCTKDLNQTPISSTTLATFYSQPSDFIQATNAIYNGLMYESVALSVNKYFLF